MEAKAKAHGSELEEASGRVKERTKEMDALKSQLQVNAWMSYVFLG